MKEKETFASSMERVAYMEILFDEVSRALREGEGWRSEPLQKKIKVLQNYFSDGSWLADYTSDEAGEFPADFKRGVLSQDGLHDLLMELSKKEQG